MITGVTNVVTQVNQKHLQLLLDAVPGLKRVGFLSDPSNPSNAVMFGGARRAAAQYSVEARFADAAKAEEIESAITSLDKQGVQALVVMAGALFDSERQRIVVLATAKRWPSIAGQASYAEAGGFLAYGVDRGELYRRSAVYVDKILKGAKPGDLPIEQPTKFELVVNMSTAKALGIKIPQSLLVQATRVIE